MARPEVYMHVAQKKVQCLGLHTHLYILNLQNFGEVSDFKGLFSGTVQQSMPRLRKEQSDKHLSASHPPSERTEERRHKCQSYEYLKLIF